jgi:hypothetical protein
MISCALRLAPNFARIQTCRQFHQATTRQAWLIWLRSKCCRSEDVELAQCVFFQGGVVNFGCIPHGSFHGFSSCCSLISNISTPIETIIKLPRHQRIPSGAGWACALGYRGTAQKICSMDAQLNSCDMGVAWDVGSTSINMNININWR